MSTNRDKEGVKEFVSTIEGNDVNLWKVPCWMLSSYGAFLLSELSNQTVPSLWEFYYWSKLSSQIIQILNSMHEGDGFFFYQWLLVQLANSDFWKEPLVSVKILAEAAFVHFNVSWLSPRASKMKWRISYFLIGYSRGKLTQDFLLCSGAKNNFRPHDKFYIDLACPKQIKTSPLAWSITTLQLIRELELKCVPNCFWDCYRRSAPVSCWPIFSEAILKVNLA